MSALTKYLAQYAEPESLALEHIPGGFKHGLVTPCYQESVGSLQRFISFAESHPKTLLIVVLNRPQSDHTIDWALALQKHLNQLDIQWQNKTATLSLFQLADASGVLLIDRCINGPAIPDDQGVGLARKIGADILCYLIQQQKVSSPWIANTDADAILPVDYFEVQTHANDKHKHAALCYPFKHIFIDQTPQLPTLLYEFSLHYYVAGLSYAQSPYSYHTIGSAIAVHYQHYAMVRGFPKRAGAEDFYLLNKLAKTADILSLQQPTIELQSRESTRVPFGTGPAVINLASLENPLTMPLYHPSSFVCLKFFIELLALLSTELIELEQAIMQLQYSTALPIDIDQLLALCNSFKLQPALNHSFQHGKDKASRLRHLQQWFDGFKTLKFIHYLRDQHLASISYQDWGDSEPLFPASNTMLLLQQQIKTLS